MVKQVAPIPDKSPYKAQVKKRLEALMPVLAQAAVGDFTRDVPLTGPHDEFSELYVGVQLMLEVIREKLGQLKQLNIDLETIVAARTNELYGSETKFRAVADTANDAILTIDKHGAISYMNRAAEIIFGRPLAGTTGKSLTLLIPDLDPNYLRTLPPPPSLGSNQLGKLIEATAKHRTGHKFPVELSFATWQTGAQTFSTAIIRDLTVHQMLVRKLAQKTEQLESRVASQTKLLRDRLAETEKSQAEDEALLSSIGEGVVAMNKVGRIFFANREFARLTGASLDDIKGRHFYSTIALEDQTGRLIPRPHRPMQKALQTGRSVSSADYFYRSADNRLFPVSVTATPIILKGNIIGGIDVIRDITKEREVDRLKSEFVSLASHQLRTPATAVKGLLSLLLEGYNGTLTAEQTENLTQAFAENEHELKIIDDMLDVAKLDAGQIVLEYAPVDIASLLRSAVAEQHELIRGRRQVVHIEAPKSLTITADKAKLQMVFDNLLTNASKYSPEGGKVELKLKQTAHQLMIQVKDDGIGIAAKDLPNLFKRFSRAANAEKTGASGSGLGLYLAKQIVDLHRGRIQVASELGRGSTFTVILPKHIKE